VAALSASQTLTAAYFVSLAAGLGLWAANLRTLDIRQINDLGLVSILNPAIYAGAGLLCLSFMLALKHKPLRPLFLSLSVVSLIVVLYGTTSIVEPEPRFGASYKHLGVTDFIMQNGRVDPTVDAYFNWPDFFVFAALLTRAAGLSSAATLAQWTPVVLNLLYLLPVLAIMRSATRDQRLVWLATWLFFICNWISQDYFSPQGMNFFLYLVVLAVLLTWFKRPAPAVAAVAEGRLAFVRNSWPWRTCRGLWLSHPEAPNLPASGAMRVGLLGLVVLLYAFIVASHQLTPFAILAGVAGLAVLRRLQLRGLPVLMAVMIAVWLVYMAVVFMSGHLGGMLDEIGNLGSSFGANVDSHLAGSPDHLLVVRIRMWMTVAIFLVGAAGVVRRMLSGRLDVLMLALAFAPFPLVGMQSYGGEMLLRVYLFALAPMAFLAATAFLPRPESRLTVFNLAAIGVASAGLLAGFLYARFGNERMDYFTTAELQGMDQLYQLAPQGSTLLAFSPPPWRYAHYTDYTYDGFPNEAGILATSDVHAVVDGMQKIRQQGHEAYLVISRSQKAELDLLTDLRAGSLDRMQVAITRSGAFDVRYQNADAAIYTLNAPMPAPVAAAADSPAPEAATADAEAQP
jgi:hypothetical protein